MLTMDDLLHARPLEEWHEDIGDVLWWTWPVEEVPYCGSPLDTDWPGYHTHWTRIVVPTTTRVVDEATLLRQKVDKLTNSS